MIRYALKCANNHSFDSWFQSAAAFDSLSAAGHVECPICGGKDVAKAIMAPRVSDSEKANNRPPLPTTPKVDTPAETMATGLPPKAAEAMKKLREAVEANSDYVGRNFAEEARAIHDGSSPERAIHGEANAEEARTLVEDGIPILPLPFRDRRGTN
ncbi:MAG: DUF1178 family protein [Pseudomonadota bacterium]